MKETKEFKFNYRSVNTCKNCSVWTLYSEYGGKVCKVQNSLVGSEFVCDKWIMRK